MITIHLEYVIDPYKIEHFERYAKQWIALVEKFGGNHQGYFLPCESSNNVAYAIFSFESLGIYEQYRQKIVNDKQCQSAFRIAEETQCILSFKRSFMRPLLPV